MLNTLTMAKGSLVAITKPVNLVRNLALNLRKLAVVILTIALSPAIAFADGKLYASERVPPQIPYQRALMMFDKGNETLLLQSKYDLDKATKTNVTLGWVVPAPAIPELDSMTAREAADLFQTLGFHTLPKEIQVAPYVIYFLLAVASVTGLVAMVFLVLSYANPAKSSFHERRQLLIVPMAFSAFLFFCLYFITYRTYRAMASPGIDIIRADDIGVYQAKVIKANSSVNLISWLKENGFQFQSTDLPVLDDYIRRDWCFVVAAVKPEKLMAEETYFGGLIAPIILRFKTSIPIYPLALTSTIGTDTQLVIYILNQVRVQCRNRLPMTFAGNHSLFAGSWAEVSQHKQVFKGLEETNLTYLTKFKGTLTPAQMRKDLEFEAAPDNKPFRENIYVW